MALVSLREAARRFDVTRPTLSKALKSGKISGTRDDKGHWQVETAELGRVYRVRRAALPDRTDDFTERNVNTSEGGTDETVKENMALRADLEALRTELAVAQALAEERARLLDTMVKQITDETTSRPRRKWWPWSN